jgi:predicted nuclease of predicted toxin-antitoxin system
LKLLLDEMYPPALARALAAVGIQATTITDLGMNGAPDPGVFACAVAQHHVLLTYLCSAAG